MLQDRASRYLALTATLVMLLLPVPADAHGGVYRGPGATVGPGGATGGGPSANTGGFADTDPAAWSQWWSFNRDRYLALRDAVFHGGPSETGFDDFFLGHGSGARWGAGLRPTEDVLQGQVVPALLAALERQKDTDIITACLLALAKVGDPPSGPPRVAQVIRPWIAHGNQEVHETATIAIGVLASAEGATLLADLLLDRPAGRAAAGRGRVPERTRAFAAYGLALIGYRARTDAVRRYVVHELAQAVNGGDQPSRDPMVAAIIGMGMVRLAPGDGEPDPEEPPAVSASREGQLTFLFEHWESRRLDPRVRAHIAVPLARLADGAHPTWKTRVVDSFRGTLAPQSKAQPMVQHGALMGAGLLGDNDQDPDDQRLRQALMQVVGQGGDRLARHLALLSLGRVGAREGAGDAGGGPSEARTLLMRALARGQSAQRPWAALAIGLLERGNVAAGRPPADATRRALLDAYDKAASPSERGALAVALGLMAERRGAAALLESTTNGDENLRANAMLALGLMGADLQTSNIVSFTTAPASSGTRPSRSRSWETSPQGESSSAAC